jgi:N-acetylglutamate synthase-like GNAT family acetyltransferase
VYAAFDGGRLKGFASVEPALFGRGQKYLDLSCIHVSEDMRGKGIGKVLFCAAKAWAKEHGARKLYISAHSAVETQAFYKAMGCVEAEVYHQEHVEREPYDCQLECVL